MLALASDMDFDVCSQVSSTSSVYSGLDDYEDLSGTSTYAVDQFESKLEKKNNHLLMLAWQLICMQVCCLMIMNFSIHRY